MKHRYIQVGHNAWAMDNAASEIAKVVDREILAQILAMGSNRAKILDVGDHSINDIKNFFSGNRIMNRYASKQVNPKFYSKIKI